MRSTLLLPTAGAPVADAWVMVFDPDGAGNRALKQPYPIDQSDYDYDTWTARIGATTIDDRSACGSVAGAGRSARWDLRDHTGRRAAGQAAHRPRLQGEVSDRQDDGAPSTRAVRRQPRARRRSGPRRRLDWQCQPQLGPPPHARLRVRPGVRIRRGARIEPGDRHGPRGGRSHRAACRHAVRLAPRGPGDSVRSVLATRHTRAEYRPFSWSFGARVDGVTLDGEITAQPADVIGLTYTDTDGESKYCYNSALATCRIRLSGSGLTCANSLPPGGRCSRS